MSRIVWVIHRPGYGEIEGLPEEIWSSRRSARARLFELNDQWSHLRPRRRVFRLARMEVR